MRKNYFLLLFAMVCIAGKSTAQLQPCGTDEMRKQLIAAHPELLVIEQEYERQIQEGIKKLDLTRAAKTTGVDQSGNPDFWYDIPIAIHVIHDYNAFNGGPGGDYIPDSLIFNAVKEWNIVYAKQNSDTIDVIQPFKKWIGNPHIRLHLATKDPNGNATKGITRHKSYLTYVGGEQSKFGDWPPTSYLNLWFVNKMSSGNSSAAAYAHLPADVTFIPYYDGVISLAEYMNNGSKTMNHEIGHCMNLNHVWGGTNQPEVECGDDNVDDTPPTKGHNPSGCTPVRLFDSVCASNYFKLYTDPVTGALSIIDYPDTVNSQNIMDYTYCDKMFTKGQVDRMHAALNSDVGGRNNLWDPANLANTGAMADMPDMKPVPDFTVTYPATTTYLNKYANFMLPGVNYKFTNQTMNDTVTDMLWTFSNGASTPTSTSKTNFTNSFTEGGWVNMSIKATGNHSGDNTVTWDHSIFVADPTAANVSSYLQDFDSTGDRDKWPMFNYYDNTFKWELANTGVYDNSSIMYRGFDDRISFIGTGVPNVGSPKGDFDDLFSIPVNLAEYTDKCNLNFFCTGASRSSNALDINDSLYIDFSADKSTTWTSLAKLGKGSIFNKGSLPYAYVPTSSSDWSPMTIALPAAARKGYVVFRFRYRPGTSSDAITSTGNNFYMDRISFSRYAAEASNLKMGNTDVAIVPNPTQGDAHVIVKDADNTTATVSVSDITGKVVYTVNSAIKGNEAYVTIPHAAIEVAGMYLVQVVTGNQTTTKKLVVY